MARVTAVLLLCALLPGAVTHSPSMTQRSSKATVLSAPENLRTPPHRTLTSGVTALHPVVAFLEGAPPVCDSSDVIVPDLRWHGACQYASQSHQPLFLSSHAGSLPARLLAFCAPISYHGSCHSIYHKCLAEAVDAGMFALLPPKNRTLCLMTRHVAGDNIGHVMAFLPFLVHFAPLCDVVAFSLHIPDGGHGPPPDRPPEFDWVSSLWHTLFPGLVDIDSVPPATAFARVLPPVQPTGLDYNFVYPPGSVETTRRRVLQRFGIPELPPPGDRRSRVTLVRRHGSGGRVLLNHDDVEAHLRNSHGYNVTSINPGNLSFVEQATAFATVDVVLGPHGAAMANLYALNPHACATEVFPAGFTGTHYTALVASERRCYVAVSEAGRSPRHPFPQTAWECAADLACVNQARSQDITLDLPSLNLALRYCHECVARLIPAGEEGGDSQPSSPPSDVAADPEGPNPIVFLHPLPLGGPAFLRVHEFGRSLHRTLGLEPVHFNFTSGQDQMLRTAYIAVVPHGPWVETVLRHLPPAACLIEVFPPAAVGPNASLAIGRALRRGFCAAPFVATVTAEGLLPDDSRLMQAISYCEYCTRRLTYAKHAGHVNYRTPHHFSLPHKYLRLLGPTSIG